MATVDGTSRAPMVERTTEAVVEAVRLLVTLATTAAGFLVARRVAGDSVEQRDLAVVAGAVVGAGVGYVAGGMLGRTLRRILIDLPRVLAAADGLEIFVGAVGLFVGAFIGALAALPAVVLLPAAVGWPLAGLGVLAPAAAGARLLAARSGDLVRMFQVPATAAPAPRTTAERGSYMIDSSAAIDGRILDLARAGLVGGGTMVPGFVIDELQGIADSGDKSRRRRGRRGLDVLEALRGVDGVDFRSIADSVPEQVDVDAKLIALCDRLNCILVTTDHNLARAAGLRGISVLNPHALGESMRPILVTGDRVELAIERPGSEPGQGVGFLDDGTMVVVEGAVASIGDVIEVEIANSVRTSVGRLMFAKLAG